MSEIRTAEAIRIIARRVIDNILSLDDFGGDQWENFPEIGEHDWLDVVAEIRKFSIGLNPDDWHFQTAYEHLRSRADH